IREEKKKTEEYYECTVPLYLPEQFQKFFRMSSDTVDIICSYLASCPGLTSRSYPGGREEIPLHKRVLMLLRYMASQETLLEISDRFNVTESSLILIRREINNAVFNSVFRRFIKWPSISDLPGLANRFKNLGDNRFTNVIGAVDGSHIPIQRPLDKANCYYNRKQFYSIILQGVCDDSLKFMDINVGWPGRVHDSKVLKNSSLWDTGFIRCDGGRYHLLGDAAYPLKEWLLTPYRDNGHLTRKQRRFNEVHSAKRQVIERAFGLLKNRFRRLQFINMISIDEICKTIVCACVFHNICILQNDLDVLDGIFFEDNDGNIAPLQILESDAQGQAKRVQITNRL
ncbi:hypothetical protein FSP39_024372, partial [Pinctada imbricata]